MDRPPFLLLLSCVLCISCLLEPTLSENVHSTENIKQEESVKDTMHSNTMENSHPNDNIETRGKIQDNVVRNAADIPSPPHKIREPDTESVTTQAHAPDVSNLEQKDRDSSSENPSRRQQNSPDNELHADELPRGKPAFNQGNLGHPHPNHFSQELPPKRPEEERPNVNDIPRHENPNDAHHSNKDFAGKQHEAPVFHRDSREIHEDYHNDRDPPRLPRVNNLDEKNFDIYKRFRHDMHENRDGRRLHEPERMRPNIPHEFELDELSLLPSARDTSSFADANDFVSFTMVVDPGIKQCIFYKPFTNFTVDHQVLRGGMMDLGLFIRDPNGEPIVKRPPSPDSTVSITVPPFYRFQPYAICMDNRKASFSEKYAYLSIDVDIDWNSPSEEERAAIEVLQRRSVYNPKSEPMDEAYMERWKTIFMQLENLFGRLRRVEHLQQKTDNYASIDKALMEANLSRVIRGSVMQVLVMLGVACIQILFIRAFFDYNSYFYRFWFGKRSSTSARC